MAMGGGAVEQRRSARSRYGGGAGGCEEELLAVIWCEVEREQREVVAVSWGEACDGGRTLGEKSAAVVCG